MIAPARILIVEDDLKLGRLLEDFLADHGFSVQWAQRGDEGRQRALRDQPDLVVLDLNLPGQDGMSVCRALRPDFTGGIIMLTARQSTTDQVLGLTEGADDYVIKPADPQVLLARIQSVLRRRAAQVATNESSVIAVGELRLDKSRLRVEVGQQPVELTATEFHILWCLGQAVGAVVTRDTLYREGLDAEWDGLDRRVDAYMCKIRRKLYDAGLATERLKSVRGQGYQLTPQ